MFGKKKDRDEFEITEEKQPEINETDESYLDSLLDIVMGNHENDSPSDVEEKDVVIVENDPGKEISIEELFGEDILESDNDDDELEEIIEVIEEPEETQESNAIENIEEYIQRTDKEQSELLIDEPEEDYLSEHDELLENLDKIVSGEEVPVEEKNTSIHPDLNEDFLENIFTEPDVEEHEEEKHEEEKQTRIPITDDDEIILQKAEEELLKDKPKKKGFFKVLLDKILKHKDVEEKPENNEDEEESGYLDENKRLLREMDEEEEGQEEDQNKKGKKQKKEKKPKKIKEKDPEMEEKVKVSGKTGFLIFSLIVVIIVGIVAGGSVLSYKQKLKDATDFYVAGDYSNAYKMVITSNLKNTDEEFYIQLRLIMFVHRYYESYENFTEMGYKTKALDALLKGVASYELYKDLGRDYNVLDEMQGSYKLVKDALKNEFSVSEAKALEYALIEDRDEYSAKVYEIINELE